MYKIGIAIELTIGISPAILELARILKGEDTEAVTLAAKLKASEEALQNALRSVPSSTPKE